VLWGPPPGSRRLRELASPGALATLGADRSDTPTPPPTNRPTPAAFDKSQRGPALPCVPATRAQGLPEDMQQGSGLDPAASLGCSRVTPALRPAVPSRHGRCVPSRRHGYGYGRGRPRRRRLSHEIPILEAREVRAGFRPFGRGDRQPWHKEHPVKRRLPGDGAGEGPSPSGAPGALSDAFSEILQAGAQEHVPPAIKHSPAESGAECGRESDRESHPDSHRESRRDSPGTEPERNGGDAGPDGRPSDFGRQDKESVPPSSCSVSTLRSWNDLARIPRQATGPGADKGRLGESAATSSRQRRSEPQHH
jgi:hypothetical protein